jgi:integrase
MDDRAIYGVIGIREPRRDYEAKLSPHTGFTARTVRRENAAGLKPRHVKVIRNEMRGVATTTAADIAVGLISTLWDFADEELDLQLDADPTYGVRRVHKVEREHEPWPQDLIEAFMLKAKPSLRWAVRLALYTGQRRSDLVKMTWSQFDGEFIEVRQQKTDELLSIPCHKLLRAELETMPRSADTILIGERGRQLTGASLSVMVSRTLRAMGITGYSIHGASQERRQGSCRSWMRRARDHGHPGPQDLPDGRALHQTREPAHLGALCDGQAGSGRKWQTQERNGVIRVATPLF